jgi:hypothetical protein
MAIAESDVIFWHDYKDGSGASVTDESGNGHSASLVASPTWGTAGVPTNLAGFIELNGTTQYGSIADHADLDIGVSDRTLAAWVYTDDYTARQTIMSKGNVNSNWYAMNMEGSAFSNNIGWILDDGADLDFARGGGGSLANSTWYFVLVDFDGSTDDMYVYLDNTQVASNTTDILADISSSDPLSIGKVLNGATDIWFLNGRVAQTIMFNRVLTSAERTDLFSTGDGKTWGDYFAAGGSDIKNIAGLAHADIKSIAGLELD